MGHTLFILWVPSQSLRRTRIQCNGATSMTWPPHAAASGATNPRSHAVPACEGQDRYARRSLHLLVFYRKACYIRIGQNPIGRTGKRYSADPFTLTRSQRARATAILWVWGSVRWTRETTWIGAGTVTV